ncbi:ArsR/SmtB family transcription factor [Devosia nitrariae]|uniref:ArsR family transcriptional regulator n=1 Tax=Devosia nitrariae TaxID=2071872 RepID=A0ABQ5W9M1_9HYPH|nr:metalloregulator ArsR/SmtB family transcription factor [Devosia nitrariae]GLQ56736.1 ArsR family transcriptional regulator [Devosia nitrariae]
MSSDNPKRKLFSHFAALARVLGNEHRLELLELLAQGAQPVEVLTARTGISFANVSQHLQQLRKAGLVTGGRRGKNIVYRLQDGPVVEAVSALRALAEHNMAEVRDVVARYFDEIDSLEPVGAGELLSRLESDSVTLLDVRPADEFRSGHIPQARNITLAALEGRISELPEGREIIAYCRGPYCVLSFQAVEALRARGFAVRRFKEGFPEWKAAGYPVETA